MNLERTAYQIVGHVYFAQQKFEDALQSYKTELQIGAAQNYARAEQTMIEARAHIGLDELKPGYSATLKQIREHYLILLRQTGQTAAAAELEKRMQSESK